MSDKIRRCVCGRWDVVIDEIASKLTFAEWYKPADPEFQEWEATLYQDAQIIGIKRGWLKVVKLYFDADLNFLEFQMHRGISELPLDYLTYVINLTAIEFQKFMHQDLPAELVSFDADELAEVKRLKELGQY